MPELLFRAKFAHQVTTASMLMDFQLLTQLSEEYSFLKQVQKKSQRLGNELIDNFISNQDYLIKSSFYFNSLQFRCTYTLELLRELSQEHEDLVFISDPITTYHLKRVIKEQAFMKELPDFKLKDL
jgi:hypothetical protein